MVFRKKSIKAKRPVRRRVYRKKPVVSKAIKTYVKRTISSNIENKYFVDYGTNQSITTQSGGGTPIHRQLLPSLVQGLGAGQRLGNEVMVKSAYIRGHVNILPYNATTNPGSVPVYLLMLLVKNKKANIAMGSSNAGHDLFELGNSAIGLQGNMLDMILPINSQNWQQLARKKVKLGCSSLSSNATSIQGYFDNSSFSVPFQFNYGKYLKKLQYEDSGSGFTQTTPVNTNLSLIFQTVYANGDTSAQYTIAEYHYSIRMVYEDA